MPECLRALSRRPQHTFLVPPSNAQHHSSSLSTGVSGARGDIPKKAGVSMFLILAVVLVVLWLGGFVMFKSAGLLIHLLLLFAVISLILHFVTGRRTV